MKRDWRYAYEFYEKHTGKPKDWDAICADMRRISAEGSPLCMQLLLACYSALEDEER